MAKPILAQCEPVPFLTSADTYRLPVEAPPSLAIHPDATPETLWSIAESRLQQLESLLNILSCTSKVDIVVEVSELADIIRAQVQGALMLAKEANERALHLRRAE
jgi:hypothetical protein